MAMLLLHSPTLPFMEWPSKMRWGTDQIYSGGEGEKKHLAPPTMHMEEKLALIPPDPISMVTTAYW